MGESGVGRREPGQGRMSDAEFESHRSLLFGIAYRMLGSVADAEDVVQDAYLRWRGVDPSSVESPRAYLSSVVTRLSIDVLRSARKQREVYVGEWLPEPVVEFEPVGARESAELAESLSTAFLLMLETLSPLERGAFLLHEVFGFSHAEIGAMLDRSEDAARQMVKRARDRVRTGKKRFEPAPADTARLVESFLESTRQGDEAALIAMLAPEVELHTDHGGKASAAQIVVRGARNVARLVTTIAARFTSVDTVVRYARINGGPGLVTYEGGVPVTVSTFVLTEGRVATIYVTRNPDKLARVPALTEAQ